MQSFLVAVWKGDECVAATQVVTSAGYLGLLLKSSLIICDLADPENYRIDAITNFGSKDPFKSKTKSFYAEDIRELAEAAKFAGVKYEKQRSEAER